MSTLVAQTISNGTVSTSSTNVIQGSAKAWVMWTTFSSVSAIAQSFNVSSVTRLAAGNYTITLTTAMPSVNYAVVGASNSGGTTALGQTPGWGDRQSCLMPVTASTISCINGQTNTGSGLNDASVNSVAVFSI
jgi:hypothetical protein